MESTRRQSKKRDAIREILLASYDHPSVEEIYRRLKPDIPDLSLGTVYRNLAALSVSGEILSLSVGDGFEHFDGNLIDRAGFM
jgi:Fur family peroxide stress response transcriptional regulator